MFGLSAQDLSGRILDCAAGPASFNAEMTTEGQSAVSCDPLYRFTAREIRDRNEETYEVELAGAGGLRARCVWKDIESPARLGETRMRAIRRFLDDFPRGFREGRYRPDGLPMLSFGYDTFGLALCSHFLFTYSEQLSADLHLAAIEEVCRVAGETRVFPLLNYDGEPSPHLPPTLNELSAREYRDETRLVSYQFQKGGNRVLCVEAPRG